MQVNIGMQFVKAGRYGEAIRFLEAVIKQYRLEPVDEFCAGQIAIGEVLGLYDNYDAQLGICAQVQMQHACREIPSTWVCLCYEYLTGL